VRPEDLRAHIAGGSGANEVTARVEGLEFLGAFYRATLTVEGMSDQLVRADFAPNVVQDLGIRENEDIAIVFPDDRMRVFEES